MNDRQRTNKEKKRNIWGGNYVYRKQLTTKQHHRRNVFCSYTLSFLIEHIDTSVAEIKLL